MRGKRVSLGIEAPRDIPVVRDELRKADLEKTIAVANAQQHVVLEATEGICVK